MVNLCNSLAVSQAKEPASPHTYVALVPYFLSAIWIGFVLAYFSNNLCQLMTLISESDPYLNLRLETSTVCKCSIVDACVQSTPRTILKLWRFISFINISGFVQIFYKGPVFYSLLTRLH